MKVSTEQLIESLAGDVSPVRPLWPPWLRWAAWTGAAAALVIAGAVAMGVRADAEAAVRTPLFLARAVVLAGACLIAIAAALRLSVPGMAVSRLPRALPTGFMAIWIGTAIVPLAAAGGVSRVPGAFEPACGWRILALLALPALLLVVMLCRAAPLERRATGTLAGMGVVALGCVGVQFVCPVDGAAHLLAAHAAPALGLVLVGTAIGEWASRMACRAG